MCLSLYKMAEKAKWSTHQLPYNHYIIASTSAKSFLLFHWLGVFGRNGPSRQYFSLYRAVSIREEERKERCLATEKKSPNNPHSHLLQAQYALALLLSKYVGCPDIEKYPARSPVPITSYTDPNKMIQYYERKRQTKYGVQQCHDGISILDNER